MGLGQLIRASGLPRGTRPPEPAPWPTQYGPWWGPWGGLPYSSDGSIAPQYQQTWADATSATLAIPAAWRATNLIAGFIAQMSLRTIWGDPYPHYIDSSYQLVNRPWPMISYFDWMFGCAASIVLRGNYYAVKADYDQTTGYPRQYIPVAVDDVTVNFEKGQLTYDIVGMDRSLSWLEVFHIRGFMLPGMLTGVGVIEAHRSGLGQIRDLMDYGAGAYGSGGVPPVVMRVDKPELSEQEAEYLQSRWVQRHTPRDRRPAVIPKIVEIEKVGLSMEDAEYLQSRQFSIAEIAYMFNLDPEDLGAGFSASSGRMQYQNLETKMRDRLIFSLNPWMYRIEQAYDNDLPQHVKARFNTSDLFRGDSLQRMQMYEVALRNDIYTKEEVRGFEHMPIEDYVIHGIIHEHTIEWPSPVGPPIPNPPPNPVDIPGEGPRPRQRVVAAVPTLPPPRELEKGEPA